ncbi:phosphatase PAP2 family protein [Porphyromonadaceae bacterium OttesenSCG-928-L07]|nr:phosphatase PAP2 family protein [Porphyromonadaceae bacterium OttesenSCG-928-L07]MDL2331167.1 phosphatase PAP2 family protein [Odoribacter sp. OttesenSCG-928-A06]
MLETLQQTDQNVFLALNGIASPFWDQFMWLFTAKLTWVPLYAILMFVMWKNFKLGAFILSVITIILVITFADQICGSLIRPLVARMRPSNPNNPISEFVYLVNEKRGGRYGFPSCHAANSFALAFSVMLFFKRLILSSFFFIWATINSYSRIYIGVHYPGDLIAGLIVGLIGALLIYLVFRRLIKQRRVRQLLKISNHDQEVIDKEIPVRYSNHIIYVGLLTVAVFCIYSLIKVY